VFNPSTDNPFKLFNQWYEDASKSEVNDPNAMSLATVGGNSMPSVRIVLLKSHDQNGFVFYTNLKVLNYQKTPKLLLLFTGKQSDDKSVSKVLPNPSRRTKPTNILKADHE